MGGLRLLGYHASLEGLPGFQWLFACYGIIFIILLTINKLLILVIECRIKTKTKRKTLDFSLYLIRLCE